MLLRSRIDLLFTLALSVAFQAFLNDYSTEYYTARAATQNIAYYAANNMGDEVASHAAA